MVLLLFISSCLFSGLVLTSIFYIYRRFIVFSYFKHLGVPGPKPNWVIGNLQDFSDENTRHLVLPKWTEKYGKIFGYFEGPLPVLVTSDVNLVQQIFVKQFPKFHSRKPFPFQPDSNTYDEPIHMFFARGQRWKRFRTVSNPTFSTSKLRAMMPLMKKCLDDFVNLIDKRASSKEDFNILPCYQWMTLETIAECGFGVELGSLRTEGRGNVMLDTISNAFNRMFEVPLTLVMAVIFPTLHEPLRIVSKALGVGFVGPILKVFKMMDSIIEKRKEKLTETKRLDLLQLLLEREVPNDVEKLRKVDSGEDSIGMKGMTTDEISAQAVLFLMAGYETSSNALAFTTYLLAKNDRVQEKLYEEIKEHFPDGSVEPNYDSVFALKYLDCVINEALRMYPVGANVVNRMAMEDTELAGVHIPAGTSVAVDVWSIHYDNNIYGPVDTKEFYPERFSENYPKAPDRDAAAFLPFGFGSRICIGMKFALFEIKLVLVSLLRKYRIDKTPQTGDKLELNVFSTISPKNGVWVKLSPR